MERSGSQKVLRILSIIQIIISILILIVGAMGFIAAGDVSSIQTGDVETNSIVQGAAGTIAVAFGVVVVIIGLWNLLCGIFGLRAANDNTKIMIVWVFLLIGMIIELVAAAFAILNGFQDTSIWSVAVALIWSVFMFWIANNIKKERDGRI
jgi:hypothetical protein